jgi:hypothetical protein
MVQANERFWRRQARRLARRANFGSWFARWAPATAVAVGVAAPILLVSRRAGAAAVVAGALVGAIAIVALVAGVLTRRARLAERDGLVWLEARLGLHNRLSAAAEGVGDWPAPDRYVPVFAWRGLRGATPIAFGAALLAAAALVPLTTPVAEATLPVEAPVSWRQTDEWIRSLKEAQVAQPESLQAFEERLDRLRAEPARDWYGENHLEAADSLRDQLRSEVRSLAADLDSAADALEGGEAAGAPDGAERRRLDAAARGLSSRSLRLRSDLLQKLREAAKARSGLPPLEGRSLARALRENAGFCRLSLRECREGDANCLRVAARKPGRGGVDRGPGSAPLTLDAEASKQEPSRMEGVSNTDMRQASLGDVVETTVGQHRVSTSAPGLTAGGRASAGAGGDAVSKGTLTPEERRILARYFK